RAAAARDLLVVHRADAQRAVRLGPARLADGARAQAARLSGAWPLASLPLPRRISGLGTPRLRATDGRGRSAPVGGGGGWGGVPVAGGAGAERHRRGGGAAPLGGEGGGARRRAGAASRWRGGASGRGSGFGDGASPALSSAWGGSGGDGRSLAGG